jgi:hypothetical protein
VAVKKVKNGRPTKYSEAIAKRICDEIANSSKGLAALCREIEEFPDRRTIYNWLQENESFFRMYARAKSIQADYLAEEILEISDCKYGDEKISKDGEIIPDNEFINRSRLRVDSRKWLASKLLPKIYGDKVQNEICGKLDIADADFTKLTDDELRAIASGAGIGGAGVKKTAE